MLSYLSALAQAGKKTYTLLMGKPNPAKLANFPEIEVFVMLADPQGLILDSKEYLSPIITPHEALLAFTNQDCNAAAHRLPRSAFILKYFCRLVSVFAVDFQELLNSQRK